MEILASDSCVQEKKLFQQFLDCGGILNGHFILASGLHSATYVQCAAFLQNPQRAESAAASLVQKIPNSVVDLIDLVVAPAMGGLIIGHEVARALNKDFIFFERVDNVFTLKRFDIKPDLNVLLVEDVVTTGNSSLEVVDQLRLHNAKVITEVAIINRAGQSLQKKFSFQFFSLLNLNIKTFDKQNLPQDLKLIPAKRVGSKRIC